ncbi:hypothetical protein IB236_18180 [Acidovorax sp. ACV02]|uniref:hypothetical protein n=1 Tax=Acidovorax sp. ACV02 TaxID=2769310 RepID=UPI00178501F6|nr:hypothetical protein [Acidovorax sp. ACV02]MBD9407275.1 hypothetical protein [Acidovorax sp. ACV02]
MFTSLENPPDGKDIFLWTDYIEILALTHPDRCYCKGDLSGLARRLLTSTRRNIDYEQLWRDVINFSSTRRVAFGEFYPFEISDDQDTLSFKFNATPEHHAYVGLLIASSLRLVSKEILHRIARQFEEASLEVFKGLQPVGAEVRATWAGAGAGAVYQGKLYEKMLAIANDLRCTPNFKVEDFDERDTGDGGIDLIAWHPMSDERDGMPISFAQCGCSKADWTFKQIEAHPAKHIRHLPVMHPWATYYFMPLDLRRSDGDFAKKSDIGQAIIVDRLRILRLAKQFNSLKDFPAMPYVTDATQYVNPDN